MARNVSAMAALNLSISSSAYINGKGKYSYDLNTVRERLFEASMAANPLEETLDMLDWLLSKGADPDANLEQAQRAESVSGYHKSFPDYVKSVLANTFRDADKHRGDAIIKVLQKHGLYQAPLVN